MPFGNPYYCRLCLVNEFVGLPTHEIRIRTTVASEVLGLPDCDFVLKTLLVSQKEFGQLRIVFAVGGSPPYTSI